MLSCEEFLLRAFGLLGHVSHPARRSKGESFGAQGYPCSVVVLSLRYHFITPPRSAVRGLVPGRSCDIEHRTLGRIRGPRFEEQATRQHCWCAPVGLLSDGLFSTAASGAGCPSVNAAVITARPCLPCFYPCTCETKESIIMIWWTGCVLINVDLSWIAIDG